jgi:Tfp pilus assembly protein PilN
MKPGGMRKWLAVGTGVGIEIRGADLHVVVARVRPAGVRWLGATTIASFRTRPAADWGKEYAQFLRKLGLTHLAAHVLLPREEVIVRQISLPGVKDSELDAAVRFQVDSLHPYGEDDVAYCAARVGQSSTVLVGIARREVVERYFSLLSEAGVKTASISFSAAAIYSGIRLLAPPAAGFLALHQTVEGVEAYGESEARPLFSALFTMPAERAQALAAAELRLPAGVEPRALSEILPFPRNRRRGDPDSDAEFASLALAYAAALAGACPRLSLDANLLAPELRSASSRLVFAPTVVLASALALLLIALSLEGAYNRRRYLDAVNGEIKKLEPQARRASELDKSIETLLGRAQRLDQFRQRSKADMDLLHELTQIVAPPAWLSSLEITRTTVYIGGEAEQAAPLIKQLDNSKLLENSEFSMPLVRGASGEIFRIRSTRENAPKEEAAR